MKFTLSIPPSTNKTYRFGKGYWYKIKEARDWELETVAIIYSPNRKTIDLPCEVSLNWFLKRDRDIDGGLKIILDVLEKAQIIENDSQVHKLTIYKKFDKKNPRIELEVNTLSI